MKNPNNQKHFSEPNLLWNLQWSSCDNLCTGWRLSSTQIWPGFNTCVAFSPISVQWYCVSRVFTGASIKERLAEMSGFCVWWLLWEWHWSTSCRSSSCSLKGPINALLFLFERLIIKIFEIFLGEAFFLVSLIDFFKFSRTRNWGLTLMWLCIQRRSCGLGC